MGIGQVFKAGVW